MYFEGPLTAGKTLRLIDKFVGLINSGVLTSQVLVICANSFKRKVFLDNVREKLFLFENQGFGSIPIYTFNGIVYNTLLNNWPVVEDSIPAKFGNAEILPHLCGLETTEYLLKLAIEEINKEKNSNFKDYYADINLLHQLLRRYRLIIENSLTDEEVEKSSVFLGQTFSKEACHALIKLKNKTLILRSFDYLRQTGIFAYLLENNKISDFKEIKYLIVDDFDELSYSAQSFIKLLIPNVEDFYIAADPDGGARRGYLCAYPQGWDELKSSYKSKVMSLNPQNNMYKDAQALFENIKFDLAKNIENITVFSDVKRVEMFDRVLSDIDNLLKTYQAKPHDIAIITPSIDENIKSILLEFFRINDLKYQFLAGTKNLIDDNFVFGSLIIAQLINDKWNLKPSLFEIRILLTNFVGIPVNLCKEILDKYKRKKSLDKSVILGFKRLDEKYQFLTAIIEDIKSQKLDLKEQLLEIFSKIIVCELNENSKLDNFNRILKSLEDFIRVIDKLKDSEKPELPEKEWLIQVKNTVVTDNPPFASVIETNSLIIATPQKIVDMELKTKYQIWLDVSGSLWLKDDTGPLYNSWVFQKDWKEKDYTTEVHKELTLAKTAHLLRKLVLCASEKILAYSSQLNTSGSENIGILPKYLEKKDKDPAKSFKTIIPREDQKQVLEYKGGYMAVPAVPGAGKTTIMLGLIIELIKYGVNPEEILVLTYMESAARLFLDKIKKSCPGLVNFPSISTIHGIAHRIIQDEDNFTRLGLNSDFDICDDIEKSKIVNEICLKHIPLGEEDQAKWMELNLRAISKAKLAGLTYIYLESYLKKNSDQLLEEFLPVFKDYTLILREKSLIDFDDLLIMATNLLKEHKDIREYYQKRYKFIIEDEAQDSSKIQQELITIISQYHGNLIRCGDTNQAITTTFSNADVQGFRDFIENNKKVEMLSSQRCAKDIYELANHLINWSKAQPYLKDAFLDLKMKPVKGKNPEVENSLNFKIYNDTNEEKHFILREINRLQSINPDFTFGILTRTNKQTFEWASFLDNNQIKFVCMTNTLNQRKVFKFLVKLLEVIDNPWKNSLIYELYQEFISIKILKKDFDTLDFLKNKIGSPFVSFEPSELHTENLVKLWWDINYWLDFSYLPPEELIIKLGTYYFENIIDRSNIHLLAALVKKYRGNFTDYSDNSKVVNFSDIVKSLKELGRKNKTSGIKFFNDQEEGELLNGFVQVMTVHKSKGNEFDVVFIPEMNEDSFSYAITPEKISIKSENALIEKINKISNSENCKTEFEIKKEQMEECLRLIYVAITRAKRYLYMSSSYKRLNNKGNYFNNIPSRVLEYFISLSFKLCNK